MTQSTDITVFVAIVTLLVTRHVTGQSDEDEWLCAMESTCVEVLSCAAALNSIRKRGEHPYKRCGWDGPIELVCCPFESTSQTVTGAPVLAGTRSTLRPSDVACTQYASGVALKLDFHILGGEAATEGEFPHMVALGYLRDGQTLSWECAGSLISDQYVLTAAHCLIRLRPVSMRLGTIRLNETGGPVQDYAVAGIHLHPNYVRRTGTNDVALLRSERPVQYTAAVHPACLHTEAATPDVPLLITGWGRMESGTAVRAAVLQKARVRTYAIADCNQTYVQRLSRLLGEGQLCAGSDGKTDSCQGDSGGPLQLFTKRNIYAIVGVVSFGITDCGGDVPSVYTRVYHYLDWIEGIVWP